MPIYFDVIANYFTQNNDKSTKLKLFTELVADKSELSI
jgi:hypothetical protein